MIMRTKLWFCNIIPQLCVLWTAAPMEYAQRVFVVVTRVGRDLCVTNAHVTHGVMITDNVRTARVSALKDGMVGIVLYVSSSKHTSKIYSSKLLRISLR